jgi:hypothetical protein
MPAILAVALGAVPVKAGFFEELFGDARETQSPDPRRRIPHADRAAHLHQRGAESARPWRYRTGRPFFEIGRNNGSFASVETPELRWDPRRYFRSVGPGHGRDFAVMEFSNPTSSQPRLLCVRTCDGAVVSLAKYEVADASHLHPSCDGACPGSETRLFRLPENTDEISNAVEAGSKTTYAELVARVRAATASKPACVCGSIVTKDHVGVDSFFADPTLRYGDLIATSDGLRVFRGGGRFPHRASDFLAFNRTMGASHQGATNGALTAINRMLKTPDRHGFSATVQFGPR